MASRSTSGQSRLQFFAVDYEICSRAVKPRPHSAEQRPPKEDDTKRADDERAVPDHSHPAERGDGAQGEGHLHEGDRIGEPVVPVEQAICLTGLGVAGALEFLGGYLDSVLFLRVPRLFGSGAGRRFFPDRQPGGSYGLLHSGLDPLGLIVPPLIRFPPFSQDDINLRV